MSAFGTKRTWASALHMSAFGAETTETTAEPSQRHAVIHLHKRENEMAHPATEKRGGNPDVKQKSEREKPKDPMERKLEQGLEESMTGSDPVSVTQPKKNKHDEKKKG